MGHSLWMCKMISCTTSVKIQFLRTLLFHKVLVTQSCLTLCNPMDYIISVHGILQARILEWIVIPFSRVSSWLRDWTWVSLIAGRFFTIWATREKHNICVHAKLFQSCPTLCNAMDHSLPNSSVHGILQTRILKSMWPCPPGDLPDPEIKPESPASADRFWPLVPGSSHTHRHTPC